MRKDAVAERLENTLRKAIGTPSKPLWMSCRSAQKLIGLGWIIGSCLTSKSQTDDRLGFGSNARAGGTKATSANVIGGEADDGAIMLRREVAVDVAPSRSASRSHAYFSRWVWPHPNHFRKVIVGLQADQHSPSPATPAGAGRFSGRPSFHFEAVGMMPPRPRELS